MNKKKDLRKLFHKYIERTENERFRSNAVTSPFYGGGDASRPSTFCSNFSGCIYFYEWSNTFSQPKRFYTMEGFKGFLRDSCIYLALYQEDIIKTLKYAYISCKKGTKELVIRQSYVKLCEVINSGNVDSNNEHSIGYTAMKPSCVVNEPYVVGITRPPIILQEKHFEPEGRWFG